MSRRESQVYATSRYWSWQEMDCKTAGDLKLGDRIVNELERLSCKVIGIKEYKRYSVSFFRVTFRIKWLQRCAANREWSIDDTYAATFRHDDWLIMGKQIDKLAPGGINNWERHLLKHPIKRFFCWLAGNA